MKSLIVKLNDRVSPKSPVLYNDLGLLVLRVFVGSMMAFSHGLGKMLSFFAGGELKFADPIGIGIGPSLFLAGSAEFICALALVFGILTRFVTIPLIFTMSVAVMVVHADDPFQKKEFALLYLIPFVTLALTGPGRFSIDAALKRKS